MLLNHDTVSLLAGMGRINRNGILFTLSTHFASILGIIWLSYKAYQTRYSLKGSKIRFKRFLLPGVIFTLSIVLSGLFGVLEGNKRISRSILLGDITQKYEAACDKKKKEQVLTQKMEEFTTCYEEMNDIFVNQEKRLTDKNMEKLTRLYQNLPEKQQKEVQDNYERTKKDVQYFKDTQTEEACYNLFSDTIPFQLVNRNEKNGNNQLPTNVIKHCFSKQRTYKIQRKKKRH